MYSKKFEPQCPELYVSLGLHPRWRRARICRPRDGDRPPVRHTSRRQWPSVRLQLPAALHQGLPDSTGVNRHPTDPYRLGRMTEFQRKDIVSTEFLFIFDSSFGPRKAIVD